jgi:hypothetical protein
VLLDRSGVIESLLRPARPLAGTAPGPTPEPRQRPATLARERRDLGGLVRAQPVFVGTKLTGYRIYRADLPVSVPYPLGLRPGSDHRGERHALDDRANEICRPCLR